MENKKKKSDTPKNVAEISRVLSERLGIPRRKVNGTGVEDIIEAFLEDAREAIQSGQGVRLKGIGSIRLVKSNRKRAYNPRTGKVVLLEDPPIRIVFNPSRKIKRDVCLTNT